MGASVVTCIVIFFISSLGSLLISAMMISLLGIAVHGATRTPDDLFLPDDMPQQDGGLLALLQQGPGGNSASVAPPQTNNV